MSLQVIFSVYAPHLGEISAFTAGDDQTLICQTQTIVEATIIGNPANHIFEWEQIDGSPVTWLTPMNQQFRYQPGDPNWTKVNDTLYKTRVSIQRSSPSDLELRFWIDRRSKFEQHDDVMIYGTPTSTALTYNNGNATSMYYNVGDTGRRYPGQTFDVTPDFGTDGVARQDIDFDLMLRWNAPTADAALVENVIIEVVNDTTYQWEVVDTLPKDATTYGPVLDGRTYRVRYIFLENTNNIEEYRTQYATGSRPALFRADNRLATALSVSYATANAVFANYSVSITGYSVLERTLQVQNYESDVVAPANAVFVFPGGAINSYSVLVRTLLTIPASESDGVAQANAVIAPRTGSVTAYNVLNIGGIIIGG